MLTGKELGQAIEQAINKKMSSGAITTKAEVARHFKIQLPSIYDWIKRGSIRKDRLPDLWEYFSDVVGPEHWGIKEFPNQKHSISTQEITSKNSQLDEAYQLVTEERRVVVDFLLSIGETAPNWVDSDVRAYISTMDTKASEWLKEKITANKSNKSQKTGT